MDLLYKLEKRLLSTDFKYFIKYLFQGKFNITYSFSYNCKHYINKIENFYNVILDMDNNDNIFDSLENLITEKLMDGDNKINCEKCKKNLMHFRRLNLKYFLDF